MAGTPSMVISGAADKTEALKKYSTYQKAGLPPPGMGSRPATGSPITSKGKPRVLSGVAAPKSGRAGAKVTETVPVAAEARAPIELQGQFLACVMAKQFVEAEMLCRKILTVEPTNPTVLEFLPVLREKLELGRSQLRFVPTPCLRKSLLLFTHVALVCRLSPGWNRFNSN